MPLRTGDLDLLFDPSLVAQEIEEDIFMSSVMRCLILVGLMLTPTKFAMYGQNEKPHKVH